MRLCSVDGCGRKHAARGYCGMHHTRWWKYGDAGEAAPRRGAHGSGCVDQDGYRKFVIAGKPQLEHRMVMEGVMGRSLHPWENVHHINGVRLDNRPENLELWCKPQPAGQRVDDLVAWVVENYPDLIRASAT